RPWRPRPASRGHPSGDDPVSVLPAHECALGEALATEWPQLRARELVAGEKARQVFPNRRRELEPVTARPGRHEETLDLRDLTDDQVPVGRDVVDARP